MVHMYVCMYIHMNICSVRSEMLLCPTHCIKFLKYFHFTKLIWTFYASVHMSLVWLIMDVKIWNRLSWQFSARAFIFIWNGDLFNIIPLHLLEDEFNLLLQGPVCNISIFYDLDTELSESVWFSIISKLSSLNMSWWKSIEKRNRKLQWQNPVSCMCWILCAKMHMNTL
jgi:hypothetical protein